MVKTIKTVKQLKKHIGETLHVVSREGYEFDATVETTGNPDDPWCILKTTNKVANKDHSWWPLNGKVCHNCAFDYQISEELTSLTTIDGKASKTLTSSKKKTVKVLTKSELDAARGHFCLLEDGSKGFICQKTAGYSTKPTRVLHNSENSHGWEYTDRERYEDDAPESIKHTFSKAYNANDEDDAAHIKVIEVLEKYDGRKYRCKKADKDTTEEKKDTKFLTASEITAGIGHFCKLADGQEAFIASSEGGSPVICMRLKFHDNGWFLEASDVAEKFRDSIKDYKYGWGIHGESDAKTIKVVEILDTQAEPKCAESTKKSVLDLTVRELLEKIYEAIER